MLDAIYGILVLGFGLVFLIAVPRRLDRIADALEDISDALDDEFGRGK